MLRWALIFLMAAMLPTGLGLGPIAGIAVCIAKSLFIGFLLVFFFSLILKGEGIELNRARPNNQPLAMEFQSDKRNNV